MTFDGTKWNSHTKEKYGLPGHDITALAVGQTSGQVWAGFSRNIPQGEDEGGLAVQENNSWRTNYTALPSRYITNIIIQNDVVWVCTDRGLLKFSDTGHWAVWNTGSTKLPSNYITCAREDSRGNVWITTANSGLVKRKRN
jgi:ligand-binding sensor domain-containing protein